MIDVDTPETNKIPFALAAIMFFSPFMQYMMKKGSVVLSEEDEHFVSGYVQMGYITLLFLGLSLGMGIGNYLAPSSVLQIGYAISIGILLVLLLVGSICILANVSLRITTGTSLSFYDIGNTTQGVILKYIPLYNIYLWYTLHAFGTPNRWLKESLLRWTFFIIFAFTNHPVLLSVFVVFMILRIATLMAGIDVLHLQTKQDISNLFFKNPEEIRGYVTGFFVYATTSFVRFFYTPSTPLLLHTCVQSEKDDYAYLYDICSSGMLWVEYGIGIGLAYAYRYLVHPDMQVATTYIPLGIIVGRYLIMLAVWKHLPHLPLAREVRLLLTLLFIQPFRFLFHRREHGAV